MFSFGGFSELSSFNERIFDIPEERARLSKDGVGETISAQAHESLFPTLALFKTRQVKNTSSTTNHSDAGTLMLALWKILSKYAFSLPGLPTRAPTTPSGRMAKNLARASGPLYARYACPSLSS